MANVTAKRALLQLLSAAGAVEVSAAILVEMGELLGFTENNVRVTLARLLASGTVELTGRGMYKLGEQAQVLGAQVRRWDELERQVVRRWDGGWACAYVADLPRSDRAAQAKRDRALRLLGFRALSRGLEVRPDNLEGGVDALRDRLSALGAGEPVVFRGSAFDEATETRARALWSAAKLTTGYRQTRERIARWLVHAESLEEENAAREAFHFGGDILRQILFDPRLPEPLVDVSERRAMLEAAKRLDLFGRRLWYRLFGMRHGLMPNPEKDHEYYLAVH